MLTKAEFPALSEKHLDGLNWFALNTGQETGWPKPLNDLFLVNKAKGIHKPAGSRHAISIRKSIGGPYLDQLEWKLDGTWVFRYSQEGQSEDIFTNRALIECRDDNIPVGVLLQVKEKPNPRYKIIGLGKVTNFDKKTFTIEEYRDQSHLPVSGPAVENLATESDFSTNDIQDARTRELRSIAIRRGQANFRNSLLDAYNGKCAVSGCPVTAVLEAAHIIPYNGKQTHHTQNGILLRADLHTLFDLGLLLISPTDYTVHFADSLISTEYRWFNGMKLSLPVKQIEWPSKEALKIRQKMFAK